MEIGHYLITGEIARGGMAIVYRAHDPRANRTVALKLLQIKGEAQRARFLREVRSLTQLRHRYVVAAHDAGEAGGYPYLVLDLVEGESLEDTLQRQGALEPQVAVELVRKLAQAVEYAHSEGIVHRDLKPDNVLIDAQGEPRLTDFGLAKLTRDEGEANLSKTGVMFGTPGYWSPEQATGDLSQLGPATDVYGLGATLYACLTGRPPIQGETVVEYVVATLEQAPPPAGIDRKLDAICARCLEKAPARRYSSALELEAALADWIENPPGSEALRRVALGLSVALVVLLATVGFLLTRTSELRPSPEVTAAAQALPSAAASVASLNTTSSSGDATAPVDAAGWFQRGRSFKGGGDRDRAIQAYTRALELRPGYSRALNNRGWNRQLQGDFKGAIEDYTAALLSDPDYVQALINRGISFSELERYPEAALDFGRVIQLKPEDADAFAQRARVQMLQGDPAGASKDLKRALELEPENAVARGVSFLLKQSEGDFETGADDLGVALKSKALKDYVRPNQVVGSARFAHDCAGVLHESGSKVEVNSLTASLLQTAIAAIGSARAARTVEGMEACWSVIGKQGQSVTLILIATYRHEAQARRLVESERLLLRLRGRALKKSPQVKDHSMEFVSLKGTPPEQGFRYTLRMTVKGTQAVGYGFVLQEGRRCVEVSHSNPTLSLAEVRAVEDRLMELLRAER